jgi:signal transduction histidine kinase
VLAVRRAGESGAALVRQLLTFSRRDRAPAEVVDLNAIVRDVGEMLPRLIGGRIAVVTDLAPDLECVSANPGQLQQVIMNLAVNARDAMPGGGTLLIETRNTDPPPGEPAGRWVRLTVADTGHGMDEATRARMFEPFFTTKEVGKGTGLGLATVYAIVQNGAGTVDVDSSPGKGTRFSIHLPRAGGASVPS